MAGARAARPSWHRRFRIFMKVVAPAALRPVSWVWGKDGGNRGRTKTQKKTPAAKDRRRYGEYGA